MTRNELRQRIIQDLGACMVKVELSVEQIDNAINNARDRWIHWTVGNSKFERYFLLLLKAGERVYDMPAGVIEVVYYEDKFGSPGGYDGIGYNPLWYTGPEMGSTSFFSIGNPAMMGFTCGDMYSGNGSGSPVQNVYTPVDSYLMRNMSEMLTKYRPNKYQWTYHKSRNQLELHEAPLPGAGTIERIEVIDGVETTVQVDSPGYVLIRAYFLEGSTLPTYVPAISGYTDVDRPSMYPAVDQVYSESLFDHFWIIEYATAYAKQTLGLIRRKLSNVSVMGNAAVSLDGNELISEAREDMRRLEDDLDLKYSEDGYGIICG